MNNSFAEAFNFYSEESRKMSGEPLRRYKGRFNFEQKRIEKKIKKENNRKKNKAARKSRKRNK